MQTNDDLNFVIITKDEKDLPIIYINDRAISFTRGVLNYLKYPANVLFMIDAKKRVFAVRACEPNESRAFQFSLPEGKQKRTVTNRNKNVVEPVLKLIGGAPEKGLRYKVIGYWIDETKTLCFDLNKENVETCHSWGDSEA